MKRRTALRCITCAATFGSGGTLLVMAQTPAKVPRIGVLRWGAPGDEAVAGLAEALASMGYRQNQGIAIEWRFATNKEVAQRHAAELVGLNLDLIVAIATPAAVALHRATRTVPIVLGGVADPVGAGLVATLARPGGNITGVSSNLPSMVPKQLQLLGEVVGGLQRVAFLGSTDDPATKLFVNQALAAARMLGVSMQVVLVSQAREFDSAVDAMVRERAQAVIVQPLFAISQPGPLVELLARRKLPCVSAARSFAVAGGLITFGFSRAELWRRAASFVDRVLKGAPPASLPVEEPTTFELAFNLKTAKALGITISQSLRLRADEVFE